jgi:hypothetical protein
MKWVRGPELGSIKDQELFEVRVKGWGVEGNVLSAGSEFNL